MSLTATLRSFTGGVGRSIQFASINETTTWAGYLPIVGAIVAIFRMGHAIFTTLNRDDSAKADKAGFLVGASLRALTEGALLGPAIAVGHLAYKYFFASSGSANQNNESNPNKIDLEKIPPSVPNKIDLEKIPPSVKISFEEETLQIKEIQGKQVNKENLKKIVRIINIKNPKEVLFSNFNFGNKKEVLDELKNIKKSIKITFSAMWPSKDLIKSIDDFSVTFRRCCFDKDVLLYMDKNIYKDANKENLFVLTYSCIIDMSVEDIQNLLQYEGLKKALLQIKAKKLWV